MKLSDLKFDKVYCINLERRTDRRNHAVEQFQKLGIDNYQFYPAIDASTLGLRANAQHLTFGMVGCYMSHYMIFREAYMNGYDRVLIFEDDFNPIRGGAALIADALPHIPNDWEFAYLGYSYSGKYEKHRKEAITINSYWAIPGHNWGTQCFMIQGKETFKKLLDGLATMRDQVDVQLTFGVLKQLGIKYYAITPSAIGQCGLKSDVQTK
jgi:GR25 family glycosyltransferase involved in LPS biosynthesis